MGRSEEGMANLIFMRYLLPVDFFANSRLVRRGADAPLFIFVSGYPAYRESGRIGLQVSAGPAGYMNPAPLRHGTSDLYRYR